MSYKNAAAAVSLGANAADSFAVVRQIPFDRRTVPAKPMIASATIHAPAHHPIHSQANGPAQVETIDDAPQGARLARRDRLVLRHLPLVKAIAIRTQKNVPDPVDLDDLVRVGVLGLFDAASKFNPEKQVLFSSYAKHYIRGAMLDSLRQLDCASRLMRRRHKKVKAATAAHPNAAQPAECEPDLGFHPLRQFLRQRSKFPRSKGV